MSTPQDDYHRKTVGEWLSRPFIWRIPVYQRHYAWDAEDESGPIHLFWETVKEQTDARLKNETPPQHYLGAVLVDNKTKLGATDKFKHYDVVDGQQRLTTIQIALLALAQVAEEHGYGQQTKESLEQYVFADESEPRLVPTGFDLPQFKTVLFHAYEVLWTPNRQKNMDKGNKNKSNVFSTFEVIKKACRNLIHKHHQHGEERIIEAIKESLTQGFDLVLIVLRENDEAQRIFESLNNFAKPLTTFDLIRNNIFYRAGPEKDVELFNSVTWQNLENPYWEKKADRGRAKSSIHIEAYIARMLVAKMQEHILFDRNSIFNTYQKFAKKYSSIDNEIISLASYTGTYQYLDSHTNRNPIGDGVDFGIFLYKSWPNREFYPVIFSIVGSDTGENEKQRMLRLLESYVARRSVCDLSTKSYNKYAASICRDLGDKIDYKSLLEMLMSAEKDTTLFPNDERVVEGCINKEFYDKKEVAKYVLTKIAKHMEGPGGEADVKEDLTIDHILPQKWEKNPEWKEDLLGENDGDISNKDAIRRINERLHTIGNLTLLSNVNNPRKSNLAFKGVKLLLKDSSLRMNRGLAQEDTWNAKKIEARSKELAGIICKIWPYGYQ